MNGSCTHHGAGRQRRSVRYQETIQCRLHRAIQIASYLGHTKDRRHGVDGEDDIAELDADQHQQERGCHTTQALHLASKQAKR